MLSSLQTLHQRVMREILGRGWSFALPQVPCIAIFFMFAPEMFQGNWAFLLGITLVIIGTVIFSVPLFQQAYDKRTENVLAVALLIVSLGWSAAYVSFFHYYGFLAQQSLITTVLLCGITAGAFILLTPNSKLFYCFFLPLTFIPSLASLMLLKDVKELTLLCLIALYNIFLILSAPPIRKRFHDSILNEIRLGQEKDKVEGLINAFPGIVSVLDENQVYRLMNDFGKTLIGRQDVEGNKIGFMSQNDDLVREVQAFYGSKEIHHTTKEILVNFGERKHWFLGTLSRIPHLEGWIVIIGVLIDELVEARSVAEKEKLNADHAARLASLGDMAQGVAHEINNPLAVVMFAADEIHGRAKKKELDSDFAENFSQKIISMSQRIAKIVKSLRYFSRDAENDPIRITPVSTIIDQAADFRTERRKNHGTDLEIAEYDADLLVECREVQVMQALINILNNADDAVANLPKPWIRIEVKADHKYVSIRVVDAGHGISNEVLKRMFEPFYTTKDVNQGSGLGLSIALGLMEKNGGNLKYIPADHTTFELVVPRAK